MREAAIRAKELCLAAGRAEQAIQLDRLLEGLSVAVSQHELEQAVGLLQVWGDDIRNNIASSVEPVLLGAVALLEGSKLIDNFFEQVLQGASFLEERSQTMDQAIGIYVREPPNLALLKTELESRIRKFEAIIVPKFISIFRGGERIKQEYEKSLICMVSTMMRNVLGIELGKETTLMHTAHHMSLRTN